MDIRQIVTEADYEHALSRASELMSAGPGTEAEKDLRVFFALVELYEDEVYPFGIRTLNLSGKNKL